MTMRALEVVADRHSFAVAEQPVPDPGPGQLRVKVEYCGICGSDLHMLAEFPTSGATFGHEFVGIIDALGPGVDQFSTGERVTAVPALGCGHCVWCVSGEPSHCAQFSVIGAPSGGAFAEYVIVQALFTVRVPEGVSPRAAAVTEPLAVGLRAVEASNLVPGDDVVVFGAGPIGIAIAIWLRQQGVGRILVSDPVASRRRLALEFGATAVVDPLNETLAASAQALFGGLPSVVIEAAGRPGMLASAIDLVAPHGRIVLAGMHSADEVFQRIPAMIKEPVVQFPQFSTVAGFQHTLRILARGDFDAEKLVTHVVDFGSAGEFAHRLLQPNDFGKVLVDPSKKEAK
ncbi:zinc-dependent alcohol dehydrogenase [Kribbella speibonae]|nr:alcohol dehydrogenase catalytic domain-containing protein [Kribbella speibonae]